MSQFVKLQCNVGELYFIGTSSVAKSIRLRVNHDAGVEYVIRSYKDKWECFYDIGANVGLFSILASQIDGDRYVVAFEPEAANLECLRKNIDLTGRRNIKVVPSAISDDDGVLKIGKADCGLARYSKTDIIEVPTRSIDSFSQESGAFPHFMKLDVEGSEMSALNGATKVISQRNSIVELEFSYRDHGRHIARLLELFPDEHWDCEIQFQFEDIKHVDLTRENIKRVKHIDSNQIFWTQLIRDRATLMDVFDFCKNVTDREHSRKWEVTFSPKHKTILRPPGIFDGFEVRDV